MKRIALILAMWFCTAAGQVTADPILYTNGSTFNSYAYASGGYATSNSFVISSESRLTSVSAEFFTYAGVPQTIDWAIGTSPLGNQVASGTGATLSSTPNGTFNSGTEYLSSFSLSPNPILFAGTYYLTLFNGTTNASSYHTVYWTSSYGAPSTATAGQFQHGSLVQIPAQFAGSGIFTVYGNPVPEPSTLALFGMMAAVGMGFGAWRYLRIAIA